MKYIKTVTLILLVLILFAGVYGCFKQAVETDRQLPDIIWPKPPNVPRIRFVNSISGPEDLNIKQGAVMRFFSFLKGAEERALVAPYGIETDRDGRIYVIDTFDKHIHVFDPENGEYYRFPQNETSFISPIDIAISKNGAVFVTDSKEAVIRVFKKQGKEYIKEIGRGVLNRPTGIAVNEKTGELLVVDTLSSEIIRYDLESHKMKGIIGRGGNDAGLFHYPTNIFVSGDGHIFVSDSLNFRIQIFTPEWDFLYSFGRAGDGPGFFSRPKGVAVDSEGNIYVVDALFDNVQVFDKQGRLLMDFGGPGHGYGEFWLPSGIFIDNNDMIYISDSYNKRVQVFQYMKGNGFIE